MKQTPDSGCEEYEFIPFKPKKIIKNLKAKIINPVEISGLSCTSPVQTIEGLGDA